MSSQAKKPRKRKINADIRSFLTSPPPPSGLQNPSAHEDLEQNDALVPIEEEVQNPPSSPSKRPPANDIYNALNKKLEVHEKEQFLNDHWKPPDNFEFPSVRDGNQNRKFQSRWLENFDWLVYSPSQNGAYCKFCVIFRPYKVGGQTPGYFVTRPWTQYKNGDKDLCAHSKHQYHLTAAGKGGEFDRILKSGQSVTVLLDKNKASVIEFNRKRLVPIVKTILLCARCKLPLRGHRDNEDLKSEESVRACASGQHGVFRAFLVFRMDAGDSVLINHIATADNSCTMISPKIQNEIIGCIGTHLQQKILDGVKKSRFYSILCDETTDISTTEQMTICIRYVNMDDFQVCEHFLGFVNVTSTTGQSLKETLCKFLDEAGLSLTNLRGQGYDGGSNMSGKFRGLQALIRQDQPLAFYVHCFCHSLNLSVSKGCEIPLVRNLLGILASVSAFLSASAKRVVVMTRIIEDSSLTQSQKKKLKPLCQTRWTERHNSVLIFRELYPFILQALDEIKCEDDAKAASSAAMFESAISRGDFIVAVEATVSVLSHTHSLSVLLQDPKLDLSEAMRCISLVIAALQKMKDSTEESFKAIFEKAKATADQSGVSIVVPRTCSRQRHRNNVRASTAEDYYRQAIFLPLIEHFTADLSCRFNEVLKNVFALQGLIPSKLDTYTDDEVLQAAKTYEQDLLCVSMDEVLSELAIWRGRWKSEMVKPSTAVEALVHCNNFYPNLHILLQIFATLPITTATAERTFSVLKLLKTYLRSTMKEERLNGLALASIYKSIDVDVDAVVENFAKTKPRRLEMMDWSKD